MKKKKTKTKQPPSIATQFFAARKKAGLTQQEFAERLGCSFATINRAEMGRTVPSRQTIAALNRFIADAEYEAEKESIEEIPANHEAKARNHIDFNGNFNISLEIESCHMVKVSLHHTSLDAGDNRNANSGAQLLSKIILEYAESSKERLSDQDAKNLAMVLYHVGRVLTSSFVSYREAQNAIYMMQNIKTEDSCFWWKLRLALDDIRASFQEHRTVEI